MSKIFSLITTAWPSGQLILLAKILANNKSVLCCSASLAFSFVRRAGTGPRQAKCKAAYPSDKLYIISCFLEPCILSPFFKVSPGAYPFSCK